MNNTPAQAKSASESGHYTDMVAIHKKTLTMGMPAGFHTSWWRYAYEGERTGSATLGASMFTVFGVDSTHSIPKDAALLIGIHEALHGILFWQRSYDVTNYSNAGWAGHDPGFQHFEQLLAKAILGIDLTYMEGLPYPTKAHKHGILLWDYATAGEVARAAYGHFPNVVDPVDNWQIAKQHGVALEGGKPILPYAQRAWGSQPAQLSIWSGKGVEWDGKYTKSL